MSKIIVYEPVVQEKDGSCFVVNGALNRDKDEAVRITNKHSSIKDGDGKIIRIDRYEIWED